MATNLVIPLIQNLVVVSNDPLCSQYRHQQQQHGPLEAVRLDCADCNQAGQEGRPEEYTQTEHWKHTVSFLSVFLLEAIVGPSAIKSFPELLVLGNGLRLLGLAVILGLHFVVLEQPE